jgi:hypothetical protein
MIYDKLTIKQQHDILSTLFGFEYVNVGDDHYVLYNEDGYEFYGSNYNLGFDFSTLHGIFVYATEQSKKQGYNDCKRELRKFLEI